jgi:hypothetical protein
MLALRALACRACHPSSLASNVMSNAEFQSTSESASAKTTSAIEAEMVGVNLIRLLERPRNSCAVLRTFSAADKILVDWSLQFGGIFDCEFEITYGDGYKVSGNYRFAQKGSTKPALTRHLRSVALAACGGESCLLVRGLKGNDFVFLDRYETNDWP